MKILITGGAGFIGSNLCDYLLEKNNKLVILDNLETGNIKNLLKSKNKIKFFKVDITNMKKLKDKYFKKIDVVFHLAALADIVPSINNPEKYFNTNVKGTLNILEKCKKNKVKKLIYAASSSCYGIPKKLPINENAEIKPEYPYALTKYLGETLVLHWAKVYNMHNISVRLFNAYGPRSRTNSNYGAMFGVFLSQKINNKPLTVVGDGKQTRDFLFISDLVSALHKTSILGKKGEIYNISSGKQVSINKIVKLMKHPKTYIPKRPGEPENLQGDISKIKKTLNWAPKVSIEKGIKIMVNNINGWKSAPVWTPTKIKKATKDWFKYLN